MSQGLRQVSRLALAGAVLLASAPLALAASVPPAADELTEFTADLWTAGADGATATVADDTVTVRRGKASLRFDTDGGFDTWLATPPKKDAGWDFTAPGVDGVGFWVRAQNPSPVGFQNSSPWIRLHTTAEDYIELHSVGEQLNPARFNWIFLFAPLEGASNWTRTEVGSPDLSEVNWIEIHADTWDFGFTLWVDGLQFSAPQALSLDVTPPSIAVPLGIASRFSAELIYDNGQTPSATAFSVWSADPPSSATVLGPGSFFGTTEGAVAISAALGFGIDLVGTAMLEVLPPPAVAPFELVSVSSQGTIDSGTLGWPNISGDARFVVFTSSASNLVPGDVNGFDDVFVKDRQTGMTELVSVGLNGEPANGNSLFAPQISDDGRFVVFISRATNLVARPSRPLGEIFVRDRREGTTTLIDFAENVADVFAYSPVFCGISGDGSHLCATVVMLLDGPTPNAPNAWRYDLAAGVAEVVSADASGAPTIADSRIHYSAISDDGRYIAFASVAALSPDATPGVWNAYRKDMETGEVILVSVGIGGSPANGSSEFATIDGSGSVVAFLSTATNLIDPPATNVVRDAYVRTLPDGPTTRISSALDGGESNGESGSLSLSGSGRFAAFRSSGTDLFEGDTNGFNSDMFRVDLLTGARDVVTLAPWGLADGPSIFGSSLNYDGTVLLFPTDAGNLALGDTNLAIDALIREYPPVDPADLDGDGIVGGADLAILLGAWGSSDPAADLDGDGVVGASDLAILLGGWKG